MIRKQILNEGSAREIARVFLEPLIRQCPQRTSLKKHLENLFGVEHRTIECFQVKAPFKMPGRFRRSATEVVQALGPRSIKRGWEIWVRVDAKRFHGVDVEVVRRGGQESAWFILDQVEFSRILKHLKKVK